MSTTVIWTDWGIESNYKNGEYAGPEMWDK